MLDGIRVIDLTMHLSGPYCTWLLAHLGADVIKVERPGGDPARRTAPLMDGESLYFASINRNKRSIVLDLKSDADRTIFKRLLTDADLLVENYRPGVMGRLGFDTDALQRLNPRLIHASISGFGQDGPYAGRPAFDVIAQAMSGVMSITGPENGDPVRVGMSVGDMAAALFAALDIVASLFARQQSGTVPRVDVSMLDCQMALLENAVARNLNLGDAPRRIGTRHPLITPFQAFTAYDAPFVIATDGEASWLRLCSAIGADDLAHDPRFTDGARRNENHAALEQSLNALFETRQRDHWLALLEAADIACGPLNDVADALASPQIEARTMVSTVARAGETAKRFAAAPIAGRGSGKDRPAPRLDEHGDALRTRYADPAATGQGGIKETS